MGRGEEAPLDLRYGGCVMGDDESVPLTDHRETASDFRAVVAILNDRWRVIECSDRIQWILQRRDGRRGGGARWAGNSYFRTRDALIRFCRTRAGHCATSAMTILAALPERYPAEAGNTDASA